MVTIRDFGNGLSEEFEVVSGTEEAGAYFLCSNVGAPITITAASDGRMEVPVPVAAAGESLIVDPAAMLVGQPYTAEFMGQPIMLIKSFDGSLDCYLLSPDAL